MLKNALKRPIVLCLFTCMVMFGIVACSAGGTGGAGPTPTATITKTATSVPTQPVTVTPSPTSVPQSPFKVTKIDMAVNPATIAGLACGTSLTVTYTATIHVAANSPGGTVKFNYTINNGRGDTPASISFNPGETTKTYSFTWSGALLSDHVYPGAGGILVTSPNQLTSSLVAPTGQCTVGAYQPINALSMSDAYTGWARTTTGQILHTIDGGNSWQNVTPPYPAGSVVQPLPVFTSLNGTDAWVAVSEKQQSDGSIPNVVFRTSDDGNSWQEAMLPQGRLGVSQVQFVNAQDGWVLAGFGGGAAGSQGVNLFRTTDGGQTWSLVASAPGSLPLGGLKTGMGWASPTTGWVTGCVCAAENTILLSRTQDGGVTWQTQSLPLPALQGVFTTEPPVFFSATEGILPVSINYQGRVTLFAVYATHDGGATWSHSTLLMGSGSAWDFPSMQQGWVVIGNGSIGVTSNGGQSWLLTSTSANFQNITQLDFVSAQVGWAISTNPSNPSAPVLLKTMDGGKTWVQIS